jgi:hypothetical protein
VDCIITGCTNPGRHNLGVRLRRTVATAAGGKTSAVWAPNTDAFFCDDHATSGVRITLLIEATNTGAVETTVYGVEQGASRSMWIEHPA